MLMLPEVWMNLLKADNMPSEKILRTLSWLDAHGIRYEVHYHPPLFTIEEALAYWKDIDSTHCKNLFFRNHKGNRHYLVSFECHKNLDIPSTADPKELFDNGHRVKYFLDSDLRDADRVSFHPCDNSASVVLSHDMFMRFLELWGGEYEWLEI